jgi:hypothetical protein
VSRCSSRSRRRCIPSHVVGELDAFVPGAVALPAQPQVADPGAELEALVDDERGLGYRLRGYADGVLTERRRVATTGLPLRFHSLVMV